MAEISRLELEIAFEKVKAAAEALKELGVEGKKTETTSSKLQASFAKLRDVMQGPVAAAKMVIDGFKKIKAVSDEMEDAWKTQERAVSNLESVLKATGGTVGRTSKELQDMAAAFQEVTVFGDEAIINMNAVLLGFRGITGDQFERTTEAVLDMATIMGTDLVSAANMLGKALDGPTQGISALSRVGFVFTKEQKEMVAALEKSGDLLGAQEIILGEVEKAFGGAARAAGETGSAMKDKLANAIGDVNEQIGRSISNNLKPLRQAWIDIATAIAGAMKANNDYVDAVKANIAGKSTLEQNIMLAEKYQDELEKVYARIKAGRSYNEDLWGTPEQVEQRLREQRAFVQGLHTQRYMLEKYGEQQKEVAAAEDKEQAKIDGRIAALKATADGIKELTRQENQRLITADEAAEKIKELYKTELWELDKLGYKIGDTTTIGSKRMNELAYYLGYESGGVAQGFQAAREEAAHLAEELQSVWIGEENIFPQPAEAFQHVSIGEENIFPQPAEVAEAVKELRKLSDPKIVDGITEYGNELERVANLMPLIANAALLKEQQEIYDAMTAAAIFHDQMVLQSARDTNNEKIAELQRYQDAETAVAERLADAQERAYESMGKTFADSMLEGEGLWKSFARAGTEALASVIEAYALEFGLLAAKALIPGLGFNPAAAAGYLALSAAAYMTAGTVRAIPMAEGGSGTVDKPTLFLAGEAGKEDFDFSPHSKGGRKGGVTIIQNIAGSVWTTQQLESLAVGAVAHAGRGF